MSFGHGNGSLRSPGYISDKTMYIALNYQEQAEHLNASTKDEIAAQLVELEQEQSRLKYYVSLLEARETEVIRLIYFSQCSWSEVSKKLGVDFPCGAPYQGSGNHETGADVRLCRRQSISPILFVSCLYPAISSKYHSYGACNVTITCAMIKLPK